MGDFYPFPVEVAFIDKGFYPFTAGAGPVVYSLFRQSLSGVPSGAAGDNAEYTLGMQFTLSKAATLTGIWFYSATGAPAPNALPAACGILQMTGPGAGSIVTGSLNTSPSWSGGVGSGWVKCAYASGPVLSPGTVYKVCVRQASNFAYSVTSHYWDTGAGSGGLVSGIITAPSNAGGDGGQDTFVTPSASLLYPATAFNAGNYWVDVEVTA